MSYQNFGCKFFWSGINPVHLSVLFTCLWAPRIPQSCYTKSSLVTRCPCAFLAWDEPYHLALESQCLWSQARVISCNSNTTALSGRTSSRLAIYSMNTKISPISDFTRTLIDRLSHPCWHKLVRACVCTYPRMSKECCPVSTVQQ